MGHLGWVWGAPSLEGGGDPAQHQAHAFAFASPDYVRPTPPPRSGYHRYQLRLYEQPAGQHIALSPEELLSLGKEQTVPPGALLWVLPSGFAALTPCARGAGDARVVGALSEGRGWGGMSWWGGRNAWQGSWKSPG